VNVAYKMYNPIRRQALSLLRRHGSIANNPNMADQAVAGDEL